MTTSETIPANIAVNLFRTAWSNVFRTFFGHTELDTDDGERYRVDSILFLRTVNAALAERTLTQTQLSSVHTHASDYVAANVDTNAVRRYADGQYQLTGRASLEYYVRERLFILFTLGTNAVTELLVHALTEALMQDT